MKRVKFERRYSKAIADGIDRARLATPLTVRTLTVNFADRTLAIDGRFLQISDGMTALSIPILNSERVVLIPATR